MTDDRLAAAETTGATGQGRASVGVLEVGGWGRFVLGWSDAGLMMLGLPDRAPGEHLARLRARGTVVESTTEVPGKFRDALEAYLRGDDSHALDALPLVQHGTPFQRSVWRALRAIPFGQRSSYGAIARAVGQASAVRAVGNACGANPLAITVPCHRVIGADGSAGGFAAGVAWKRRLLEHELRIAARRAAAG